MTAGRAPSSNIAHREGPTVQNPARGTNGQVLDVLMPSDAKVYPCGNFSSEGETAAYYIAHWNYSVGLPVPYGARSMVNAFGVAERHFVRGRRIPQRWYCYVARGGAGLVAVVNC